ncbi:MAG: hypothetical protein GY716_25595 [bacterium]|nr:hypothetical protein [bacterium]
MTRLLRCTGLCVVLICGLSPPALHAQAPSAINYEGLITDSSGTPLASGDYRIEFSIWDGAGTGTGNMNWGTETHDPVPVVDGRFSVLLGTKTTLDEKLRFEERYLAIRIGPAGGAVGNELAPRTRLLSTPFALSTAESTNLVGPVHTLIDTAKGQLFGDGANGSRNFELTALSDNYGYVTLHDHNGGTRAEIGVSPSLDRGFLELRGPNGVNVVASSGGSADRGEIRFGDAGGSTRARMGVDSGNEGRVRLYGPNGNLNADIGYLSSSDPNLGEISLANFAGDARANIGASPTGYGFVELLGPNGNQNVTWDGLNAAHPDNGAVSVRDSAGDAKAGIRVDASGDGIVWGDMKSFVVDHPTRPGHRIVYVSLEGPEAAMFWRGVARLERGRASIELPEHFAVLAAAETITVQLTARDTASKGVAVGPISGNRIEIGELFGGRGSYDVAFEVQATRKEHADHRPVISEEEYRTQYGISQRSHRTLGGAR